MSENEIRIESCPFCGSHQAQLVASRIGWQIICLMCNASGPHSNEEKVAIARWNVVAKVHTE